MTYSRRTATQAMARLVTPDINETILSVVIAEKEFSGRAITRIPEELYNFTAQCYKKPLDGAY
jgi:hypothetical protein